MSLEAVLGEILTELRALRAIALQRGASSSEPTKMYMRVPEFAARVGISERLVWTHLKKGLPCVGEGRARRIDVARADEWLRGRAAAKACA